MLANGGSHSGASPIVHSSSLSPTQPACLAQLWGILSVTLAAVGCGVGAPDNTYQEPPPPEVTVAKPIQKTVEIFVEENGETEVVDRAEVRARVRGFLEEVNFIPGQKVTKDENLYVIQRSEYQAAVNSAKAALSAAEGAVKVSESQIGVVDVELTRAKLEFDRYKALLEREAASQSQFDEALANRDAAAAQLEAAKSAAEAAKADRDRAEADLAQAQLDLDYTLVTAPISGRVTKTEIKVGNLIENGDLLATVVDRDQIYANFNVSDRTLLRLQKAAQEMGVRDERDEDSYRGMKAYLRRDIDEGFPFEGELDYVDQEGVDQATGTFAMRAIFDNPDGLILPGLFIRVRVPIGEITDALVIPEQSLFRDQMGSFVLAVDSDKKIVRKNVTPGQIDAGTVVIEKGIGPDDLILIEGGQRARPGIIVTPTEIDLTSPTESGKTDESSPTEQGESDESASQT